MTCAAEETAPFCRLEALHARYRLLRAPGAVVGLADELSRAEGSRYRLQMHCNHFADP